MDNQAETVVQAVVPEVEVMTREKAYEKIEEIADFLQEIEPHSPVPHVLKRAVHWGSLPFEQLLEELIANKNNLLEIHKLIGINPAKK